MEWQKPSLPDSSASVWYTWDARWKLGGVILAMVCFAIIASWPWAVAGLLFALGMAFLAKVTRRRLGYVLCSLALPMLPFVLIAGWRGGVAAAPELTLVFCKLLGTACLGTILLDTTGVPRLLQACSAVAGPSRLVQIAQFAYRFCFLLITELRWVRLALLTRGFRFRHTFAGYHALGSILGSTILRSEARAERVAAAMRARGYHGALPTLRPFRTRPSDVLRTIAFATPFLSFMLADRIAPMLLSSSWLALLAEYDQR